MPLLGRRMEALLAWMREISDAPFDARAYVDTGPVQERVYAQHAGLGWIGRNTCLINPEIGSWLFLSEILCSLALEADPPGFDQCGTCTLCLEACPTDAFVEPWVLDSTRCLSYLTIELKGSIPEENRRAIGNHVYGCYICQEVCPWNTPPALTTDPDWEPEPTLDRPHLVKLWRQPDEALQPVLDRSGMSRAGLRGLRRNVAVALGNSHEPDAASALEQTPSDYSRSDPQVNEHVRWSRRTLSCDAVP